MQIDGKQGAGRPKQTWKKLTEKDCREWKLTTVDPQERSTWRSGVRSAMCAARQLPGKGPTDVDDAPAPARKLKNLIMMMMRPSNLKAKASAHQEDLNSSQMHKT